MNTLNATHTAGGASALTPSTTVAPSRVASAVSLALEVAEYPVNTTRTPSRGGGGIVGGGGEAGEARDCFFLALDACPPAASPAPVGEGAGGRAHELTLQSVSAGAGARAAPSGGPVLCF